MTTKNGGRIELKLDQSNQDSAEYRAELQTSTTSFVGRALVGSNAATPVAFDWQSPAAAAPPEWLTADARAALKAALRTAQAEGRWPRRITRWRPEPEA